MIEFLRRNYFEVRLADGLEVVAAMPERLLPLAAEALKMPTGHFLAVGGAVTAGAPHASDHRGVERVYLVLTWPI